MTSTAPSVIARIGMNRSDLSHNNNDNAGKKIFYFGRTKTEGTASQRELLGGKGANLADMSSIGLLTAYLPLDCPLPVCAP